jgi:DNA-binding LacI/PurR family transcriptional regulator
MIKMQQVAERAGVSVATVSRVMSGAATVNADHRDRVLQAVADLGYRPNRLARNLRRQTTDTIGVVVSEIENPHFTEMVRVVEEVAAARGFRVLLCNTDERPAKQDESLRILAADRVAGVVLVPTDPTAAEISMLLDAGVPVVAFDRAVADPRADVVVMDNVDGARRATELLLAAGHARVGFVGGLAGMQTGAERLAGYERAMIGHGLPPLVADGGFRIDGGARAATELIDGDGSVTALVVANNLMTIGVLRALRGRGRRIPDDVALVAIDDPAWAELIDPPLTTLAQPVRRMAETAADVLFDRIAGARTLATRVVFQGELRLRRSSGPAS